MPRPGTSKLLCVRTWKSDRCDSGRLLSLCTHAPYHGFHLELVEIVLDYSFISTDDLVTYTYCSCRVCTTSHRIPSRPSRPQAVQCQQQASSPLYPPPPSHWATSSNKLCHRQGPQHGNAATSKQETGATCDRDRVLRRRGIPIDCEEQSIPRSSGARACSGGG